MGLFKCNFISRRSYIFSFFSTANMASYSVSAFIIQTVIVFVAVAIGAVMPGFGQLIERKELKKASDIDLQARNLLGNTRIFWDGYHFC